LNGYVELLQSEKLGPVSDRQREVLHDMKSSGKRLEQFIQDFLTFSALETGGLRMKFEQGNINECLSGVCKIWSNAFRKKGLRFIFWRMTSLPLFPFDAPKLERIISNLLENAFKFTSQSGTVWLHAEPHMWDRRAAAVPSTSERRRQNVTQPNAVKVSVSDTGPGIQAEFHLEVFRRFLSPAGTEAQEGMGSGLRSRAGWCKAWTGRSGWRAIRAQAANFHFLFRINPPHLNLSLPLPAKRKNDEANRQNSAG